MRPRHWWHPRSMRRFGRIFFLFAAGVSLLLCVAAAGFWVRSYMAWESLFWEDFPRSVGLVTSRGALMARVDDNLGHFGPFPSGPAHWSYRALPTYDLRATTTAVIYLRQTVVPGVDVGRAYMGGTNVRVIIVPLWSVVLLTALLPLSADVSILRGRARRRRLLAGCCPLCGYDCRATPGRCSECGRVFAVENAGMGV
ncbi:MAG: hypothetical protein JWN40_5552 [Phycisphaerales bacterium]|nr:hypothetical protein [Phycisphaerales bacterium]